VISWPTRKKPQRSGATEKILLPLWLGVAVADLLRALRYLCIEQR
jgi:hypothetical protein